MISLRRKRRENRDDQMKAAEEAVMVSEISLEDTLKLRPVIEEVSRRHWKLIHDNHFSERMRQAYVEWTDLGETSQ